MFIERVKELYRHRDEKSREEIKLKDGKIIDRYSAPTTAADGKYYGRVWYFRDITERKKAEELIRNLAFNDALTNLPNRRLLLDRMKQAMVASKRSGRYGAAMFLDLDNFKPLNDTHGHDMGDLLLIEVAHRIIRCVREIDTVARFGGDEFVVMLSELDADQEFSIGQAAIVAEKIRIALAEPYLLAHRQADNTEITVEHHCTSSIGVVLFINIETSPDDVLRRADLAMYQAKVGGRNRVQFFDGNI
jgi:diguanylate cyclase (GGDEF)-like protein